MPRAITFFPRKRYTFCSVADYRNIAGIIYKVIGSCSSPETLAWAVGMDRVCICTIYFLYRQTGHAKNRARDAFTRPLYLSDQLCQYAVGVVVRCDRQMAASDKRWYCVQTSASSDSTKSGAKVGMQPQNRAHSSKRRPCKRWQQRSSSAGHAFNHAPNRTSCRILPGFFISEQCALCTVHWR